MTRSTSYGYGTEGQEMRDMTTPVNDLVAHEHDPECVCGPVRIPVVTGQGDRFEITVHRRLDGLGEGEPHGAAV